MKRILYTGVIAIALAIAGLVSVAAPAGAATTSTVVYASNGGGGYSQPAVRPGHFYFGADGGLSVRGLSWSYWSRNSAYGRGTRYYNTCIPYCYNGKYIVSPASITFWRVQLHNGQRFFTRLTMRWTRNGVRHKHIYVWGLDGGTMPVWH